MKFVIWSLLIIGLGMITVFVISLVEVIQLIGAL